MVDIMELRAYARAKDLVELTDDSKLPDTPMVQWVKRIETDLRLEQHRERMERRQAAEQSSSG